MGNNIKSETIVAPLSNTKYFEPKITDPEKKIKIIIKDKNDETEMEFKKDTKFSEVHSLYTEKHYLWSDVYKYVFNEKIIDLNKTLDELRIYNNSKICIYHEDFQDILIMDRPLSNGNISEEEKQIVNIILILNNENLKEYRILIQYKNARKLWEVFWYFEVKIAKKKFDVINFILLDKIYKPNEAILCQMKTQNDLSIENNSKILVLIKQNIWIIDETLSDEQNIPKEKRQIIKIFIMNDLYENIDFKAVLLQCRKDRKFQEISSCYEEIVHFTKYGAIEYEFIGGELNRDKTLCELGIKDGSIIVAKEYMVSFLMMASIKYILEDKENVKKFFEDKYIAIRFIKNSETIKIICKMDKKFKEVSVKFMKEIGTKKKYNFYFNGKIIDQNKTLYELKITSNSEIIVTDITNSMNNTSFKLSIEKKKETKKFNLNILYYDEYLLNKENSNNCSFLYMNMKGTFYGCHYFDLFKIVCEKIKRNKKEFILITSGSSAQKIFNYCSDINEIRELRKQYSYM